jgi:putative tryptophan/tyrosine transport system substrate-binding protein
MTACGARQPPHHPGMHRRRFLLTSLAGALAKPLVAEAQQAGKVYRVGIAAITPVAGIVSDPTHPFNSGFRREMRDRGYVEGQNFILEIRSLEGKMERASRVVAELVRLNLDAIVTTTPEMTRQAQQVATTVPIVMFSRAPVEEGLVVSLARPGGNITGVTNDIGPELQGKLLELLREGVPKLRRVAYLGPRADWQGPGGMSARAAAGALGLTLFLSEPSPNDYTRAFDLIARERPDAIIISQDATHYPHRRLIAEFAARNRLPSMGSYREFVEAGGLMSYGHNSVDIYRRVAIYVDKILRGAKPADLPIEQPTKFELVINLKTAKTLGLTIPPSLLARADQVIE